MENDRREIARSGIQIKRVNGRIRFILPLRRQWVWFFVALLYLSITLFTGGAMQLRSFGRIFTEALSVFSTGRFPPFFWSSLFGFLLWLAVVLLALFFILWQLTGQYVLEISDHVVKVGRRLLGIDLLSSYDATRLRRIRLGPYIGVQRGRSGSPKEWFYPFPKLFGRGIYTLRLDYGLRTFSVMNMNLKDELVPVVKKAIRAYFPDL